MKTGLPPGVKLATVWLLLGCVLFLGFSWWQAEQRRSRVQVDGTVIEIRRSGDGHYHWPGHVQGRAIDFLVDTGATSTALPLALANELGLQPLERVRSSTAGGVVQGHLARADIDLQGGVRASALRVTVLPGLAQPLLGMDVLSRMRFTQQGDTLRLEPNQGPAR